MYDNNFIDQKKYLELKKQSIELKKVKKVFLENSQYYIEDVRKNIIDRLTYDKVYNQGYNINTPINLELQKIATQSLRNGLVDYDRRKGWRGPIKNIKYSKNWYEQIEKKFKLEKSIEWQIAIIKKINQFNSIIEVENNLESVINYKESLIFALLGYLKINGKVNCLRSVTGASNDHSSGDIYG